MPKHKHTDMEVHDPENLDPKDGHAPGKWGVSCERCSVFAYADSEDEAWAIIEKES